MNKNDISNYIRGFNCELLSEYKRNCDNIKIRCSCGRVFATTFNRFMSGKRTCDVCSGHRYDYQYVKEYIESKGCKLLSTKFKTTHDKLRIQCGCGEEFETTFNKFNKIYDEIDKILKYVDSVPTL